MPVSAGAPPQGVHANYLKVAGGRFVEMTAPEKSASDADVAAEEQQRARGALEIDRVVSDRSKLPSPPPRAKLLVALVDGGGPNGYPALALSTNTDWVLFHADERI